MMIKKLFLASAIAIPAVALAQSAIKIDGVVDAGLRTDQGASGGAILSVGSGLSNGSRLTFTGLEDLGGGVRAVFAMETGFAVNTGMGVANPPGIASGPMTFGRTSEVGIGSERTGYVTAGRQYTPLFSVSANPMSDPFIGSWLGGNTVVYGNTVRASNSIAYSYGYGPTTMLRPAPRSGLGVSAIYVLGNNGAGVQYGGAVTFGQGSWWVGYAQHQVHGNNDSINPAAPTSDLPHLRQQTLAAAYDFGAFRVGGGVNTARNDATDAGLVDRSGWTLSAYIPILPNQVLRVLYGHATDRAVANRNFSTFQIGYQYSFSKHTSLYTAYGSVENDPAAAVALAGSQGTYGPGSRPRSLIAGILLTF